MVIYSKWITLLYTLNNKINAAPNSPISHVDLTINIRCPNVTSDLIDARSQFHVHIPTHTYTYNYRIIL